MKIKINENETYEVKINEGIYTSEEFLALLERLTGVLTTLMQQQKPVEKITRTSAPSSSEWKTLQQLKNPQGLRCPSCGFNDFLKQGWSHLPDGEKMQRYSCKKCKRTFKEDLALKEGQKPKPFRNSAKIIAGEPIKRRPMIVRWDSRDEVLKLLKTHHFGTKEQKDAFAKTKGVNWNHVLKSTSNLRKRFKIQPQEVGLKRFRTHTGETKESLIA